MTDRVYARIESGLVVETITRAADFNIASAYHADMVWIEITALDPAPQQGWTATQTSGAWSLAAPPPRPPPTLAQQALAMLDAGMQVVSTGTPGINGTYACDPASRATIAEVVAGINAGDGFPGGGASYVYPLPGGATFPAAAAFMAFAKAMRDFIYALSTVAATGEGSLPTLPVTIA